MERKPFDQFIIISGSGKKVGKTFMAKALIKRFSSQFPLFALKISPHHHDSLGNTKLVTACEGIRIFQDLVPHYKNSGQFLEAGASSSFFMETDDKHLENAFNTFVKICNPQHYPVICESGALSTLIKPGILIFIENLTHDLDALKQITLNRADLVLAAKTFLPAEVLRRINYNDDRWELITI